MVILVRSSDMKKRRRTSPIWDIPSNEFQNLLNTSSSFVDILIKIGLDPYNGNHKTLNHRIKEEHFDISILEKNRKVNRKNHMESLSEKRSYMLSDILVQNSTFCRKSLKSKLIKHKLLLYKCSICNNDGTWLGKTISLHLDHINGINNDNRLENLRFLCPNCHSQTDTYSGKNAKKINSCVDCGVTINNKYTRCSKCSSKQNGINQRKFEISKEDLEILIQNHSMTAIGKMMGVSDNSIRKRCIKLGINFKKR
jgi:5-methylcytosine-specific restriction endonuclease McrA